jgi:dinuclear metal center YbgI/SA1388 family protein
MRTVSEIVAALAADYNPAWAESWDAVGLTCGDPAAEVHRVLFAVDPDERVVEEALAWGAELLVTHHPLLLKPVHSVAADTFKGRIVHRMITGGLALYTAHTNADIADPGVSDALAAALGLQVTGPILARPVAGEGLGIKGLGIKKLGIGRFATLSEPEPLAAFAERVRAALPATATGVRVAGDPRQPVRLVAVSGGAGDDRGLLAAVRAARADAYVTSDLRHHPAMEAMAAAGFAADPGPGTALVDVAHWAGEWPWLRSAADRLAAALHGAPDSRGTVETRVSTLVTDPWTLHSG